ncbi:MAG: hypothetical protein A2Z34_06550 [Planctomycetes bacterium RBG_16_59_8]|nr:MAG: hypothetical protein A2Z34_06550 [Planctomycetes bacterium RBG_16_59_8]
MMSNSTIRFATALLLAGTIFAGGCRTSRKEAAAPPPGNEPAKVAEKADQQPPAVAPQPAPEAKEAAPAPKPEEKPATPGVPDEQAKPAPGDDAEKLLREYRESHGRETQELRALSEFETRKALELMQSGRLEESRKHAEKALELNPDNLEAMTLLKQLGELSTQKPDREYPEREIEHQQRVIEQAELEIRNHINKAEDRYKERDFTASLEEFEVAEIKLRALPAFSEMRRYLPEVLERVQRVRDTQKRHEKLEWERKLKESEAESAVKAVAEKKEMVMAMRNRLNLAYVFFAQRRFDKTVQLCDEILLIDPHYRVAKELKEDANKAKHKDEQFNVTNAKIESWKNMVDAQEEAIIPYADKVRFPNSETWKEISRRLAGMGIVDEGEAGSGEDEDIDILNINAALDRVKVNLNYEDVNIPEFKTRLQIETGLNFVIDPGIADNPQFEKRIQFKMANVTARTALKTFLQVFGLAFTAEANAVVITSPERAMGKSMTAVYNISDLLGLDAETDTSPPIRPIVQAAKGEHALSGLVPVAQKTAPERRVDAARLMDMIKKTVAPGTWDSKSGHTVLVTANNQLVVNHVASARKQVREFLQNVRAYAGTVIAVEARFYTVDNDMVEDVGVDWRNLPRIDGDDILQDVDSGPGLRTSERAGGSELYDLRAGTFHSWLRSATAANPWTGSIAGTISGNEVTTPGQSDPAAGAGETGAGGLLASRDSPLGNKLGDTGGLGMQFAWLGEASMQMVMRMLSKREKSELLWAPNITVFNGQRANIMILKQWSYIQDYDAQTGTFAGVPDPLIGIVQDGAIFDVRPVVSHDRKYVTMELRPSLILLQGFRTITIPFPPPAPVQLPWIVYEKVETTVRCPDRGGIIIGGMRDIVMRDLDSSTPILGEIPVLEFFFSRKVKTDEKRRILMLVSPQIIDLAEEEALQVQ